jgi:hypothetical protein
LDPTNTATLIALLSGGQPGASPVPDLINKYIGSDSILPPQQQSQPQQPGLLGNNPYGMLGQQPPGQGMLGSNPTSGY